MKKKKIGILIISMLMMTCISTISAKEIDNSVNEKTEYCTICGDQLIVTPTQWNFGSGDVGEKVGKEFDVYNAGDTLANFKVSLSYTDDFRLASATSFQIGVGQHKYFVCNFEPKSPGYKSAEIRIDCYYPAGCNDIFIPISGTGLKSRNMAQDRINENPFIQFLINHPNLFPILRRFLEL